MSRLVSALWYGIGRFEMMVGIFSLGLATAVLALSHKNSLNQLEPNRSAGVAVSLLASALNLYSKSKRVSRKKVN